MAIKTQIVTSEAELMRLGAAIAARLKTGDVVALNGDLGAGKTSFSRGVIQSLLGDVEVPSPTYTLVQTYEGPDYEIWHCDLYRLESPSGVLELGLIDMEADIVSLIEWPDKMGTYLDVNALHIHIAFHDQGREVSLTGTDQWHHRLGGISL